jgi:predicted nucleic-acid-binding Zn-ribbon protein
MKKSWKCPKCESLRVGYLEHASDESEAHRDSRRRLGYAKTGSVLGLQVLAGHGELEAFVCADCGYFEEYVKDPQAVRWHDLSGFRWCRPELAG